MEFVTFEIAKKLKEKGFREKCFATYTSYGGTLKFNEINTDKRPSSYDLNIEEFRECYNHYMDNNIDAPTISQVLKWLRNTHKLFISPCVIADYQDDFHRDTTYWSFIVVNVESGDSIYREYERVTEKRYESYEQAAVAGISYVLDNLI